MASLDNDAFRDRVVGFVQQKPERKLVVGTASKRIFTLLELLLTSLARGRYESRFRLDRNTVPWERARGQRGAGSRRAPVIRLS
jgi:hypothetical protein